jgi:hypothetical protein
VVGEDLRLFIVAAFDLARGRRPLVAGGATH